MTPNHEICFACMSFQISFAFDTYDYIPFRETEYNLHQLKLVNTNAIEFGERYYVFDDTKGSLDNQFSSSNFIAVIIYPYTNF